MNVSHVKRAVDDWYELNELLVVSVTAAKFLLFPQLGWLLVN